MADHRVGEPAEDPKQQHEASRRFLRSGCRRVVRLVDADSGAHEHMANYEVKRVTGIAREATQTIIDGETRRGGTRRERQ